MSKNCTEHGYRIINTHERVRSEIGVLDNGPPPLYRALQVRLGAVLASKVVREEVHNALKPRRLAGEDETVRAERHAGVNCMPRRQLPLTT